jgi:hypothetical protein
VVTAQPYTSYLLRWWHVGHGLERIEVEHIGSGTRTVVASLDEAMTWIAARGQRLAEERVDHRLPDARPDEPHPASMEESLL